MHLPGMLKLLRGEATVVGKATWFPLPESTRLSDGMVDQICETITKWDLLLADKLPSDRDLTDELEVRHTAVGDALRILEGKRFLLVQFCRGTFSSVMWMGLLRLPAAPPYCH